MFLKIISYFIFLNVFFIPFLLAIIMPVVTLLRHAQSEYNAGNLEVFDANITELGKQQAAGVTGHYDLVICSTLSRTKQTLEHSQIMYEKLVFVEEAREKKSLNCDFLMDEEVVPESLEEFVQRVLKLKEMILDFCKTYDKVLVLCHDNVIRGLTSSNVEDVLKNNVKPDGKFLENCQSIEFDLKNWQKMMEGFVPSPL